MELMSNCKYFFHIFYIILMRARCLQIYTFPDPLGIVSAADTLRICRQNRQDHFLFKFQGKEASGTGDTARIRPDVHQNNVRADALDAIPGDHQVVFWRTQTENTAAPGHNDGHNVPLGQLYTAVGYKAQPPPVTHADDLFAQKL